MSTVVNHELNSMTSEDQDSVATFRQTYHEISDQHVVEADVLEQLKSNVQQLEDLHGRLKFMMREITYLLKRS